MNNNSNYFVDYENKYRLLHAKDEVAELIEHLNERQLNEISKQAYSMMNYHQREEYKRYRQHYGL